MPFQLKNETALHRSTTATTKRTQPDRFLAQSAQPQPPPGSRPPRSATATTKRTQPGQFLAQSTQDQPPPGGRPPRSATATTKRTQPARFLAQSAQAQPPPAGRLLDFLEQSVNRKSRPAIVERPFLAAMPAFVRAYLTRDASRRRW